jgi:3'-phosphoadenosine 5'-phosphosulfate synthase
MSLTIKLQLVSHLNINHNKNHANKLIKNKNNTFGNILKFLPKPTFGNNSLTVTKRYNNKVKRRMHGNFMIKSSLIEPDGGVLVDLMVPENERESKVLEAKSLPNVKLTKVDYEWVHVIGEGWASPLKGFMRENEYLQSLHFNSLRLKDGSFVNMSLPIVLSIDDETKEKIGSSSNVGLIGPDGDCVGILRRLVLSIVFFWH